MSIHDNRETKKGSDFEESSKRRRGREAPLKVSHGEVAVRLEFLRLCEETTPGRTTATCNRSNAAQKEAEEKSSGPPLLVSIASLLQAPRSRRLHCRNPIPWPKFGGSSSVPQVEQEIRDLCAVPSDCELGFKRTGGRGGRRGTGRKLGWSPLARGTEESGGLMRYRGGRDPTKGAYEDCNNYGRDCKPLPMSVGSTSFGQLSPLWLIICDMDRFLFRWLFVDIHRMIVEAFLRQGNCQTWEWERTCMGERAGESRHPRPSHSTGNKARGDACHQLMQEDAWRAETPTRVATGTAGARCGPS
ncbi:hypothetical protein BHM03_00014577 [Ensete ventricosum]|nr:hypothetical protein BHM03_00014577 [Ensete ventricosum]